MVEGFGLKSEWQADLHVGGTPAEPLISGQLNAVKGSLDILGKNFKLARGAVTFGGGSVSNPLLDIMLTNQAPALTANITLTGTARKMQLVLSSDPEMPRDEILAQILFGKSTSELGRLENLRLAAAVAQLAGFGSGNGGGGVLDSARQALGVDVLRLNSSSSGSAQSGQNADMASESYRTSEDQARNAALAVAYIRSKWHVPVVLMGTSRGSISAADAAARLERGNADALVLSSTVTQKSKKHQGTVYDVKLARIAMGTP